MELFDKRFVHFMWEDELEGKEGFFADSMGTLRGKIVIGGKNTIHKAQEAFSFDFPFSDGENNSYRFFYYDPNYEVKSAYAEGKQIQYKYHGQEEWHDVQNENDFNWLINTLNEGNSSHKPSLRIKPEEPEPNSRPFEDFNELMSITGTKLIWVLDKSCSNEFLITGTQKHAVYIVDRWYTMKELFKLYTFSDGSPCGIKE